VCQQKGEWAFALCGPVCMEFEQRAQNLCCGVELPNNAATEVVVWIRR
jgi:hypothetical protein